MNTVLSPISLKDWLTSATKVLETAGIGTAWLDALILLEDKLQKDRSWILTHQEQTLNFVQIKSLNQRLTRRSGHEPLAYIRGFSEFYGRNFLLNKNVLQPRPESETMIEQLKALPLPERSTIADIGTGSGALAITAKLELPRSKVIATDIDQNCLKVASQNANVSKAKVDFFGGDLLSALPSPLSPDVILANLPYVPAHHWINQAAAMEPRVAISGGPDGLDIYRRLFDQLKALKKLPVFVLCESLPPQHTKLAELARSCGFRLRGSEDFIQVFEAGLD